MLPLGRYCFVRPVACPGGYAVTHRMVSFDYQCESTPTGAILGQQLRTASLAGQAHHPTQWQEKTSGISA